MSAISSTKNDKIKHLRKLYSTRQRKQKGQYVLEGSRIIRQAVSAGERLEELFMTPDFAGTEQGQALRADLTRSQQLYFITEDLLKQVSDTVNPQGVIGVVAESNKHRSLTEFERVVVLDRIQDPGNMGTIIRTAVAAGFDGIIALKGSVDIYNLKVIRSTAGAIFSIPVINRMELNELKDLLKRVEPRVIAALPDADREYTD
ncbi:MAG: TrmH family RNA methyltransferase, partial [Bacillota bacterium]